MKVTGKKLHIKREKAYYTNVQISVQSSYHCLLPSSPRFVSWAQSWSSGLWELSVKEGRAAEPTFKNVLLKTSVICKVISSFLMELLLWLVISLKNYLHNTLEKERKALASGGQYSGIKRETSGSRVLTQVWQEKQVKFQQYCKFNYPSVSMALVTDEGKSECSHSNRKDKREKSLTIGSQNQWPRQTFLSWNLSLTEEF